MKSKKRVGAFTAITAGGMVLFMGLLAMVIDMGALYNTKLVLETAVNSGVDLGKKVMSELRKTDPRGVQNGDYRVIGPVSKLINNFDPNFMAETTITVTPDLISINGKTKVLFVFAPVLGINHSYAVAKGNSMETVGGRGPKGIPLVIPHGDPSQKILPEGGSQADVDLFEGGIGFQPGKKYLLKLGAEPNHPLPGTYNFGIFTWGQQDGGNKSVHIQGDQHTINGKVQTNGDVQIGGSGGQNNHSITGGLSSAIGDVSYNGLIESDVLGVGNLSTTDPWQNQPPPPLPFRAPGDAVKTEIPSGHSAGMDYLLNAGPGTYNFSGGGTLSLGKGGILKNQTIYVDGDVDITGNNIGFENVQIIATGNIKQSGANFSATRDVENLANPNKGPITFQAGGNINFTAAAKNGGGIDGGLYANGTVDIFGNGQTINGPLMGKEVFLGGSSLTVNSGQTAVNYPDRYFFGPSDPDLNDTVSGSTQFERLLKFGYDQMVTPGEIQGPEGGAMAIQTGSAISWYDGDGSTASKQVVIPIVEYNDPTIQSNPTYNNLYDALSGDQFKVIGTALFDLSTPSTDSGGTSSEGLTNTQEAPGQIQGTFVRYIIPPPGYSNQGS